MQTFNIFRQRALGWDIPMVGFQQQRFQRRFVRRVE